MNEEKSKITSRVVKALSKTYPAVGNATNFIDDKNIFQFGDRSGKYAQCWKDCLFFGLKYPYDNTQKKNIEKFLGSIRKTDNYKKFIKEYFIDEVYFDEIYLYAKQYGIELENKSLSVKKYIDMEWGELNNKVSSVGLSGKDMTYDKKHVDDIATEYNLKLAA